MLGPYTRALVVATKAHDGQRRKYTNEPYVVHPIRVSGILRNAYALRGLSPACIDIVSAAAVMHDVLEDTDFGAVEMRRQFGDTITDLVLEVTDTSKPEDGNRAARKAIDREHLSRSTFHGASIKIADLIDNTHCITAHDPDFAKVYLAEKRLVLPLLAHGDPMLMRWALDQLDGQEQTLLSVYPQEIK